MAYPQGSIGVDHGSSTTRRKRIWQRRPRRRGSPDGIDVYFDNVGGAHLEAALNSARMFARFAICGMISIYNATEARNRGRTNLAQLIGKNIRMEGFIVSATISR